MILSARLSHFLTLPTLALAVASLAPAQEVHCSEQLLLPPPGVSFATGEYAVPPQLAGRWAVAASGNPTTRELHTYEELPGGQGWVLRQTLTGSVQGDRFAWDFHLAEESDGSHTLLVGEPGWENAGGIERGRVRVFRRAPDDVAWTESPSLYPVVPGWTRFGATLDRDGDWLAVRNESVDMNVHLYRRDPATGTWSHHQALNQPTPGFGPMLDLGGDRLVVRHGLYPDLWMYRRDAQDQWTFDQVLPVALEDPVLLGDQVLGSRRESPNGVPLPVPEVVVLGAGAAPGSWVVLQRLRVTDFPPFVNQNYDAPVRFAASESLLLTTGDYVEDASTPERAGRAHAYVRQPSGLWAGLQVLDRGAAAVEDERFGYHVAVDGDRALVQSSPLPFLLNERIVQVDLDPTDCDGDLVPDACQLLVPGADLDGNGVLDACEAVGTVYCDPAVPNSTGQSGRIVGLGSAVLADASLTVCADRLPPNEFGYLLASSGPGGVMPGNSAGVLCLAAGADLGRYTDQVLSSGALGQACTTIALPDVPTATGAHALVPGETWHFQFWHRDGLTSNFTAALEVTFQ